MKKAALLLCACLWAYPSGTAAANAAGNPERGRTVYDRCRACHTENHNRVGPRHCRLIGRPAGSVTGFDYSDAMRNADVTWTPDTLDTFLADPPAMIPGTTMTYAGVPDPSDRADLIAFLETLGTCD